MNKGDLIEAVAARTGKSKLVAGEYVEAIFASIADGIRSDEKVTIAGFGTLKRKTRKARMGVNPSTKERIEIPESVTVGFTPAQALKESVSTGVSV